jgi:hypothetical protein
LWDRLLPQAVLSLNLLRGLRLNPKLSAWAQLNGNFDFNCTPIAPPGIRVIVHEKPDARTSWSPHGLDGWYTGPALDSYRLYNVWVCDTRAERICDTISWFATQLDMPIASSTDLILAGIQDILHALWHTSPASPLAPLGSNHVATLQLLAELVTCLAAPADKPDIAGPLRVAPKPGPDATLRVATPVALPTIIPPAVIPVLPTPAPLASLCPTPSCPLPRSKIAPAFVVVAGVVRCVPKPHLRPKSPKPNPTLNPRPPHGPNTAVTLAAIVNI